MPGVPSALVLGVRQQLGQMVAGASGAGYVACDGRGDPVPVFGCALAIGAQDNGRPLESSLV